MARVKKNETAMTLEEKLDQALVPNWEWPYKLPENWCWAKLKSVSTHISDGSHNPPKDAGKGIPLLSATNIRDHSIDIAGAQRWITEEEWETENLRTRIEPNDVLLTIVATLGRTAVVKNEKFALQRSVAVIKPRINSEYLAYFFESPYVQTFISDNAKGTAQKGFYLNSLETLYCCIPPIAEQQRIVNRIESLFAKLDEAKEKAQATLDSFETRKAAILHKAFTGELTANWRAIHNVDMDSWQKQKLSDVLDVRDGTHDSPDYYHAGYPLVTSKNLKDGQITDKDIKYICEDDYKKINERSRVDVGDILFAMIGTIGNPVVVSNNPKFAIKNVALFKNIGKVNPYFVKFYLESKYVIDKMQREAKGSTQRFVALGYLRTFPIAVPEDLEQTEIVNILDALFVKENQAKETAENALEQIDLMKKAILSRAFRGELGTNDPTEESALELLKSILVDEKQETPDRPNKRRIVIPDEVAALLSSNLEKELIKVFYKEDGDLVPMSKLMAVSSKKFEVIGAIKKLQQKGIIQKTDNGDFKLMR